MPKPPPASKSAKQVFIIGNGPPALPPQKRPPPGKRHPGRPPICKRLPRIGPNCGLSGAFAVALINSTPRAAAGQNTGLLWPQPDKMPPGRADSLQDPATPPGHRATLVDSVSAGTPPPGGARCRARTPPPPGHPAGAVSQAGPPSVPPHPRGHRRRKPSAARRGLSVRDSNGHRFRADSLSNGHPAHRGHRRRASVTPPGRILPNYKNSLPLQYPTYTAPGLDRVRIIDFCLSYGAGILTKPPACISADNLRERLFLSNLYKCVYYKF